MGERHFGAFAQRCKNVGKTGRATKTKLPLGMAGIIDAPDAGGQGPSACGVEISGVRELRPDDVCGIAFQLVNILSRERRGRRDDERVEPDVGRASSAARWAAAASWAVSRLWRNSLAFKFSPEGWACILVQVNES
nr:hypothetical protein [Sphingobium sp.]